MTRTTDKPYFSLIGAKKVNSFQSQKNRTFDPCPCLYGVDVLAESYLSNSMTKFYNLKKTQ
jgi:hypothetical protein